MDIGPLDHRVRFEQQGTTTDPTYGPQPGAWTEVATVWAGVQEVLPSRAETQTDIRVELRPMRIRCRYRTDLTTKMRAVILDRSNRVVKLVSGPAELGRKDGIEFMGEEFSTAGDMT